MTRYTGFTTRLVVFAVGAGLILLVVVVVARTAQGLSTDVAAASPLPTQTSSPVSPNSPTLSATSAPVPIRTVPATSADGAAPTASVPEDVSDCTIASMLDRLDEHPAMVQRDVSLPSDVMSDLNTTYSSRQVLETAEAPLKGTAFPAIEGDDVIIVRLTPLKTPVLGPRPEDPSRIETCVVAFYDAKTADWLMTYGTSTTAATTPN